MAFVVPTWFKYRQGKAEPAGENTYKLTAPQAAAEAFITIHQASATYPVYVGAGLIDHVGSLLEPRGAVFIITSESLRDRFGERVAELIGQVLPHFHSIRLAAEAEAKELAYKFVVAGASDPALKQAALDAVARGASYTSAITAVLNDPKLPAAVGQWWVEHVGK